MESYIFKVRTKKGELKAFGTYYEYSPNHTCYSPYPYPEDYKKLVKDKRLLGEIESKEGPIDFINEMISPENRDTTRKKHVYCCGPYVIEREPERTDENYLVFSQGAKEGELGYSPIDHSVPHCEGAGPIEGMQEWARYYSFHKMDDGTYEASLDEAWYWGGSHLDGGVITRPIPEEWFELPYEEFLAKVITVAAAKHYLFTVEELLGKEGLRKFFGYADDTHSAE